MAASPHRATPPCGVASRASARLRAARHVGFRGERGVGIGAEALSFRKEVVELYHLRAFVALERTGHMTRAAEQLHLTQSAVSKQLKALEEQFGAPLFERAPAGMTLSAMGKRLLPFAQRTLEAASELQAAARLMQGQLSGTLRLGTIIDPQSIRLGELLLQLQQQFAGVDVKLEHGVSGSCLARLQAKELDACFFLGALDDPSLRVVQLLMESYRVAVPAAWADQVREGGWTALGELPWVGASKASSQTALVAQMHKAHGLTRRVVVEADQESSMIDLVNAGVGLCLVRERLAMGLLPQKNIALWEGVRLPCPLSIVLRAEDADRPLSVALLEAVLEVWPGAVLL